MVVLSDPQALRYSGKRITHEIQPFEHKVSADIVNSDASSKEVIGAQFSEGGGHQEASEDLRQTSSRFIILVLVQFFSRTRKLGLMLLLNISLLEVCFGYISSRTKS